MDAGGRPGQAETWLNRLTNAIPWPDITSLSRGPAAAWARQLGLVILTSAVYVVWLKLMQLHVADPVLWRYYPIRFYIPAILLGGLSFAAVWMACSWVILTFSKDKEPRQISLAVALCIPACLTGPLAVLMPKFFPGVFPMFLATHHPVQISMWAFLICVSGVALRCGIIRGLHGYIKDLLVLGAIFLLHVLLVPGLSPLYPDFDKFWTFEWDFMHGLGQTFLIDAANYSLPWLSQLFGHGANPVIIGHNFSYAIGIISLFTGTAAIDVLGRMLIYKYLFLAIVTFGCFTFYLYLRYGLKLSYYVSSFGGALYFLSNVVILFQLHRYQIGFWACYFFLPLSLLLITIGLDKMKKWHLFLAGFLYSSTMYLVYSHPDSFRTLFLYFLLPYVITLSVYKFKLDLRKLVSYLGLFGLGVGLGATLYVLPYVDAVLRSDQVIIPYSFNGVLWPKCLSLIIKMVIYDFRIPADFGLSHQHNMNSFFFIGSLLILVIYFFLNLKHIASKTSLTSVIKWYFAGYCIIVCYTFICGNESLAHYFLVSLNLGYLRAFYRLCPIWHVTILIISMLALDQALAKESKSISTAIKVYFVFLAGASLYVLIDPEVIKIFRSGTEPVLEIISHHPLIWPSRWSVAQLSLATSLVVAVFIYFLTKKKTNLFKVLFLVIFLSTWAVLNYDLIKPAGFSFDSVQRAFFHPESITPIKSNQYYVSVKSIIFHYPRVKHDPRSTAFIRARFLDLVDDLQAVRAVIMKSPESISSKGKNLALELSAGLPTEESPTVTVDSIISYLTKYSKDIDIFYTTSPRIFKFLAPLPPVARFNYLVPRVSPPPTGYLVALDDAISSINLDFVNWFGFHNMIRSNRAFIYNQYTEFMSERAIVKLDTMFKALDVSGVDYIVFGRPYRANFAFSLKREDFSGYPEVPSDASFDRNQLTFLKNPNSFGRVYFAQKVTPIKPQQIERINVLKQKDLFNQVVEKLGQSLLTLSYREAYVENPDINLFTNRLGGKILNQSIVSNKAVFNVSVPDQGFLVYNVAALKDWVAFCDNNPVQINYANYAFIGVPVPAGSHIVWFEYRPWAKMAGMGLVLATLLACFTRFFHQHRSGYEDHPGSPETV
ncbi:MAG: YfhO family protein [Deltaproteobacteria bacterium]|nr:YfhO family protein [Deltaproteobacteria bacterium]